MIALDVLGPSGVNTFQVVEAFHGAVEVLRNWPSNQRCSDKIIIRVIMINSCSHTFQIVEGLHGAIQVLSDRLPLGLELLCELLCFCLQLLRKFCLLLSAVLSGTPSVNPRLLEHPHRF